MQKIFMSSAVVFTAIALTFFAAPVLAAKGGNGGIKGSATTTSVCKDKSTLSISLAIGESQAVSVCQQSKIVDAGSGSAISIGKISNAKLYFTYYMDSELKDRYRSLMYFGNTRPLWNLKMTYLGQPDSSGHATVVVTRVK